MVNIYQNITTFTISLVLWTFILSSVTTCPRVKFSLLPTDFPILSLSLSLTLSFFVIHNTYNFFSFLITITCLFLITLAHLLEFRLLVQNLLLHPIFIIILGVTNIKSRKFFQNSFIIILDVINIKSGIFFQCNTKDLVLLCQSIFIISFIK